MNAPVTAVVVSWNTRVLTERCLDALAASTGLDRPLATVVVDNHSTDGSAVRLRERTAAEPGLTLIENPHNVGFAAAVNQATDRADGEYLLLLNSDVALCPGALSAMVAALDRDPGLVGASPVLVDPDGTPQHHYVSSPGTLATLAMFTGLRRLRPFRAALAAFRDPRVDRHRTHPLITASCLLLRRSALPGPAVFDERLPIFWNDLELVDRIEAAGGRLQTLPDAVAEHDRGASCRRLGGPARHRHLLGGLVRYLGTRSPGRLRLLRLVLPVDQMVRLALRRPVPVRTVDLMAALRGDLGGLPDGDVRSWRIGLDGATARSTPDDDTREVAIRLVPGAGFVAERSGAADWRLTVGRRGLHRLRGWFDQRPGARTVVLRSGRPDRDERVLIRTLGPDTDLIGQVSVGTGPTGLPGPVPRPWLLMFSASPWSAGGHRQQRLAVELARRYRVVFCDPPGAPARNCRIGPVVDGVQRVRVVSAGRLGTWSPTIDRRERDRTARQLDRWLSEQTARDGIRSDRLLWLDEDRAGRVVGRLRERAVVYDATDLDWVFAHPLRRARLRRAQAEALGSADLVIASSAALPARLAGRPAVVVPNGCRTGPTGPVPRWLAPTPRPRLAYLGSLDHRLDRRLLLDLIDARPRWTFVITGPIGRGGRRLRRELARRPQVIAPRMLSSEQVAAVLAGCDLGLLPYRIGVPTDYIHPVKLPEMLAAGLPVLSTPLPGLPASWLTAVGDPSPVLTVADGPDDWLRAATQVIATDDPATRDHRRQLAADQCWSIQADRIVDLLDRLLDVPTARPERPRDEGADRRRLDRRPLVTTGARLRERTS